MTNVFISNKDSSQELWWKDGNVMVNRTIFTYIDVTSNESCMVLRSMYQTVDMDFQRASVLKSENCLNRNAMICEYLTDSCEVNTIRDFNTTTMDIVPHISYIDNVVSVQCKDGYYSDNNIEYSVSCEIQEIAQAWIPLYTNSLMGCKMVGCPEIDQIFPNAEKDSTYVEKKMYQYGDELPFKCNRGYVEYQHKNQTKATMKCKQFQKNKQEGIWQPLSFVPCVATRCNFITLLALKPANASFTKARNRVTQREYSPEFELNQFPYFSNIVDIQCDRGMFFSDRQITKSFLCDLKPQSDLEGEWKGYGGTQLPMRMKCEAVTCMYEDLRSEKNSNLELFFEFSNSTAQLINLTSHESVVYRYTNTLKFFCMNGFTTGNQEIFQILKCEQEGNWIPRLTQCIKKTEAVNTGSRKFYEPPAMNAKGSQEVGALVIIILVIFLAIIIILDLSTITRDIKLLKKNIKYLKDYNRRGKDQDIEQRESNKKGV